LTRSVRMSRIRLSTTALCIYEIVGDQIPVILKHWFPTFTHFERVVYPLPLSSKERVLHSHSAQKSGSSAPAHLKRAGHPLRSSQKSGSDAPAHLKRAER
jgi:hypothetical protein